jgi:site-specific recombinase XerD
MRVGVRDFSLFLRPRIKGRPVYYARFRQDDGSWASGVSTGQTVRALAEDWATAEVKLRREQAVQQELERKASISFGAFAGVNFFNYDGRWALDRRASGKRLSLRQCKEKQRTFDKHVLPVLGTAKLSQVNARGKLKAKYSVHDLRHAFAVTLYGQTHDIYQVKQALGHASVSVTEGYLRSLGLTN